jgi:hypothetical protein
MGCSPRFFSVPYPVTHFVTTAYVALGCNTEKSTPHPPLPAAAPSISASAGAPSKPEGIRKDAVQAVIEAWQSAQNRGDFDTYARLYDREFSGTKRVGEKSFEFDRAGWLADRRPMFQRDVAVEIRDIRVSSGERTALAVFVQAWSSPRFRDEGQKRLEFVVRDGALSISREEMLESTTARSSGARPPPPEELSLVVTLARGLGAVIRVGAVHGTGAVRRIHSPSAFEHRVERDASPADIGQYRDLIGRPMDLYQGQAIACSGKVTSFVGVTGVLGSDDLKDDTPPERRAAVLWDWAESAQYLAAVIDPDRPDCKAEWARASDLPKPTVFETRDLSPDEAGSALSALRKTRTAESVQVEYERYKTDPAHAHATEHADAWWNIEPRESTTRAFVNPTTKATYAVMELSAGSGCGEFGGYALGFFKVTPSGWLDLTGDGDPRLKVPERPYFQMAPHVAVGSTPGRSPFFVGRNALYAQAPNGFVLVTGVGSIRTVCGC